MNPPDPSSLYNYAFEKAPVCDILHAGTNGNHDPRTFRFWRAHGAVQGLSRGKEDSEMRKYEVMFILQADLDETSQNTAIEKVSGWITEPGGSVVKVDRWGKRRMAYAIRKQREGYFVLIEAEMAPSATSELDRNLRFLEPVLRHMITVTE
jgi:small subunit ribosomal protein S6